MTPTRDDEDQKAKTGPAGGQVGDDGFNSMRDSVDARQTAQRQKNPAQDPFSDPGYRNASANSSEGLGTPSSSAPGFAPPSVGAGGGLGSLTSKGGNADSAAPGGKVVGGNPAEKKAGLTGDKLKDAEAKAGKDGAADAGGAAKGAAKTVADVASGNPLKAAFTFIKNVKMTRNKKFGLVGIFASILILVAMLLASVFILPLKVLSITTNLQNIFFSNVDDAADRFSDNLFKHYIIKQVMPGMVTGRCKSTGIVTKSCAVVSKDDGIIGQTYNAWRDANLEGKLAKDYGMEFRLGNNNQFSLHYPGAESDIDLGGLTGDNVSNSKAYKAMSKAETRDYIRKVFKEETFAKQMRYRWTVGRLLERKYGIRRCVIACNIRDKKDDFSRKATLGVKRKAAKLILSQRALIPYSDHIGLSLECAMANFECVKLEASDGKGEKLSKYDLDLRERLKTHRANYGKESIEKLDIDANEINTKGFVEYIVKHLFGETASKVVGVIGDASNPIGWIILAVHVTVGATTFALTVGPALVYMNYVMTTTAMVNVFAMYRTIGDEIKTGQIDPSVLASFANILGRNKNADQGPGAAEDSPAYQAILGSGSYAPGAATTIANTKTAAQCDDKTPYEKGQLTCPNTTFNDHSAVIKAATFLSDTANKYYVIGKYTDPFINGIFNGIDDLVAKALSYLPFYTQLSDFMAKVIKENFAGFIKWVTDVAMKYIFASPLSANMSGSRLGELMIGGADVSANSVSQLKQGGKLLTPAEVLVIRNSAEQDHRTEFASRPLKDKLFDSQDTLSVVSRLSMAIPSNNGSIGSKFGSIFSGMWQISASSIASLIGPNKAYAKRVLPDPTGIDQYGYTVNNEVFTEDPEVGYKKNDCADPDNVKKWGDKATEVNKKTGQPIQRNNNPCLLYQSAASSTAGTSNPALIDKDYDDSDASNPDVTVDPPTDGDGKWHWPPADKFHAGPCWNSTSSGLGYHAGMDMNPDQSGTEAQAAHDGKVVAFSPNVDAAGNAVTVKTSGDNPVYYSYEHLDSVNVKVGDTVVGGKTVIGVIGHTGRIYNAPLGHLHMVVAPTNILGAYSPYPQKNTVDPLNYLPLSAPYGYKCTK